MDNLTHTMIGASLARAGLGKNVAIAGPTLLIAANLPDIDSFSGRLYSNLQYFDYHRGWTHSVTGVVLISAGLAVALWAIDRFRKSDRSGRPSFLALWGLATIGGFSHILLDLANDYGLRPFLPFSDRWVYGDLISIVDPWIWLILACGLFPGIRSRKVKILWAALAVLVDGALFLMAGVATGFLWGAAAVLGAYAASLLHRRGLRPARAAFAAFSIYLCAIAALHIWIIYRAWKTGPVIAGAPIVRIAALPHRAGSTGGRPVILELPDAYCVGEAAGLLPALIPQSFQRYPKNLDDPYYRDALKEPRMAALARFARFPSVHVESNGDSHTVFLRDLRYARRDAPSFGSASVTLP
jgi:inner membrane protein